MLERVKRTAVIFHFDAKFGWRGQHLYPDPMLALVIKTVLEDVGEMFLNGELDFVQDFERQAELAAERFQLVL